MSATTLHEIVPVLQVATGPVILISGVGLLLLTMTNRLGRTIDRARQLCRDLPESSGEKRGQTLTQITIIYRRAKVIRRDVHLKHGDFGEVVHNRRGNYRRPCCDGGGPNRGA